MRIAELTRVRSFGIHISVKRRIQGDIRPNPGGNTTQVVLIGIGGYGRGYVVAMQEMQAAGQARLAAVVDPMAEESPDWPALAAAGTVRVNTVEEFLATGGTADLAVISSPIAFHADQTCAALGAGINVLCEKPMTARVADAKRMLDARDASGKFLEIGYQWSFSEAVQALKTDIMAGRLGAPQQFRTWVAWPRASSYYRRNSWAGRIRDGSGRWVYDSPANNATAHFLHHMFYLLGPKTHLSATPTAVTAECYRANRIENFDAVCCRVETHEHVDILFYSAHCVQNRIGPLFRFDFDEAVVSIEQESEVVARFRGGHEKRYGNPGQGARILKLKHSLDRCQAPGGGNTLCGPEAAFAQTLSINGLQQMPVHDFPPSLRLQKDVGNNEILTYVPDLEESMRRGCEQGQLFSEMNLPWAGTAHRVRVPEDIPDTKY